MRLLGAFHFSWSGTSSEQIDRTKEEAGVLRGLVVSRPAAVPETVVLRAVPGEPPLGQSSGAPPPAAAGLEGLWLCDLVQDVVGGCL